MVEGRGRAFDLDENDKDDKRFRIAGGRAIAVVIQKLAGFRHFLRYDRRMTKPSSKCHEKIGSSRRGSEET
jgi:hypothetical protein